VLAVFPALVGVALIVPSLVLVLDNPNWAAVKWVIVALLPYALLFTILSSVGSVFISLKRTDLMLRVNLGTSAACLAVQGALVFAFRGREGAELGAIMAGGASVTMLLLSPLAWRTALNLMGMSLSDALRPLVSTMLATLGMVVAVMGGHALLGTSLGPIPSLLAEIAVGVLSYGVLIWWLQPPALVDLLAFLGLRKGPSRNLSD
jgi:O-antigen/teichoic acid export membrane protein